MDVLREAEIDERLAPSHAVPTSPVASGGEAATGQSDVQLARTTRRQQLYSIAFRALGKRGQGEAIPAVWQHMRDYTDLEPDQWAFTTAMYGCVQAGLWVETLQLFDEMQAARVRANRFACRSVLLAYGQGRQWKNALEFLKKIPGYGVDYDVMIYRAALVVCENCGRS